MNIVYNTFMTINYKPVILDNVYIYIYTDVLFQRVV